MEAEEAASPSTDFDNSVADSWDPGASLSQSLSKDSLSEDMSKIADEGRKKILDDNTAISNEEITKGTPIGDTYEVISDAINGGMGSVWKVHHKGWNTDLAMKRPKPKFFAEGSDTRKKNFIHECEAWINLGLHPNIVSCYYVREIGGVPTIFSEWMDNGSLHNRIADKTLYGGTDEEVQARLLDIAIQFARGLHYAHESEGHLIHQDVKPDNLLLTKDWGAKVADFGLARARMMMRDGSRLGTDDDGNADSGKGSSGPGDPVPSAGMTHMAPTGGYTPAYCSLEQLEGEPLTRRTDIYSWAVSILEMYFGDRPWTHGPGAGAHCEIWFPACRIPIPEKLKTLLKQCMDSNPENRPHDFAVIEEKLKAIYQEITKNSYPRRNPETAVDTAGALNNRALSFLDLGRIEDAEAFWSQALEKNPGHADSVFNHALFLWRQGQIDQRAAEKLLISIDDREERNKLKMPLREEEHGRILLPETPRILPKLPSFPSKWSEDGEFVRKVRPSADGRFVLLELSKREGEFGNGKQLARILELDTGRVVREIDFIESPVSGISLSYPPKYFASLSPDGSVLAMSCCVNTKWKNGLPEYVAAAEFWDVESGNLLSRAQGCMFLGFTWDGCAILYDQDNNIRFGCRPEEPITSDSPLLHETGIKQDYESPFFYQLSEDLGLIDISMRRFVSGVLICDLRTGAVLRKIEDDPERRGEGSNYHADSTLLDSGRHGFALTDDEKYFLWMHKSYGMNGTSEIDSVEVWDMKTWQYLGDCCSFGTAPEGTRKRDSTIKLQMIAYPSGMRYEPGERADFRLSVVERTEVRLDAQTKFDNLLAAACETASGGNIEKALQQVDAALEIPGFANASQALRLRAEITDSLADIRPVQIIPTEEIVPPPEIIESSSSGEPDQIPDAVLSAIEKLRSDVQAEWERGNSVYDEWETYAVPGRKSLDGSRMLVYIMTVNRYDSPAQDELEVSHLYGAAVLDGVTGETLFLKRSFCSIDVDAYGYHRPFILTEEYQTSMTLDGKYLLTRMPGELVLTDIDTKVQKTLLRGTFSNAYFLKNNRFVLCKTISGYKVSVIDIADCSEISVNFPSAEYGDFRYIDHNSFAIEHNGSDILCWIVWDQREE